METAIVTGATGGIGRAVATALCEAGLRVGGGYHRSEPVARALEATLPGRLEPLHLDVRSAAAVEAAFEAFSARAGRLDALVCCAGIMHAGLLARDGEEAIREVCDVNLVGTILCVQAALRRMLKQRSGCIVTLSSVAAARPEPGQAVYAAAEGGIEAFTRAVATEYAGRGVRAYCVRLGPVETPMWAALPAAAREAAARRTWLGKPAQPVEVARLVTFLLGQRSGFSSGAVLDLDGGFLRT